MKLYKRAFTLALAVLMLLVMAVTALADEVETPTITLYPAEVRESETNGAYRLERVYYLTTSDDPAEIPTEDFDREGRHYTLLDVIKNDLTETSTKDYTEVITLDSDTKDVAEIIKVLEPELEVITEDGYSGTLKPDYTNIVVEAAGYKTSSWTVTASRTYPNLSDADVSLIPKSIEDSGRTLTLADVDWQESGDYAEGIIRYTAVATYTGTASSKKATGYIVTVDYSGEVTKTTCDTIIYTAVFSAPIASHGETRIEEPEETGEAAAEAVSSEITRAPDEDTTEEQSGENDIKLFILLIAAAVIIIALAVYCIYMAVKNRKKAKRGYTR